MTEEEDKPGGARMEDGPDLSASPHAECLLCGHCCGPYFSLYVEEEDELRWMREGRQDLLDRLDYERNRVAWGKEGPHDASTGARFEVCVYLEKDSEGRRYCGIHETKPAICRDFPPGSSELCVLFKGKKTAAGEKE